MRRGIKGVALGAALATALVAIPAAAIVYGESDNGAHPNVGSLLFDFNEDGILNEQDQLCTGTLISPTVVVTASHCTIFYGDDTAYVTFDQDLTSGSLNVLSGTADVNPEFLNGGKAHSSDVGVIVLDQPVVGIAPALLPTAGYLDALKASGELNGTSYTTVGYGAVRLTNKKAFESLLPGTERNVAVQSFLSLNKHWINFSMNQATGNGGTCYGDSGGPHFFGSGASETDVVVSVTVTGDTPCKASDVTYRLDTAQARAYLGQFVALP